MNTIHVANGDFAAQSLTQALKFSERDERVVALRDIDDSSLARRSGVRCSTARSISKTNSKANRRCSRGWRAAKRRRQLMLRRVAYHLRNAPQRLNEAKLNQDDLSTAAKDVEPGRVGRADGATAVGMFSPYQLLAKLQSAAPISVLRISRLALEWQEAKYASADTRRLRDNMLVSGAWHDVDEMLLELADIEWRPARRIVGEAMAKDFDFILSDSVGFWRCRELVTAGRLKIRGTPSESTPSEIVEAEMCR